MLRFVDNRDMFLNVPSRVLPKTNMRNDNSFFFEVHLGVIGTTESIVLIRFFDPKIVRRRIGGFFRTLKQESNIHRKPMEDIKV